MRVTSLPARRFGGSAEIILAAGLWGTTGTVRSFVSASPVSVGAARTILGGGCLLAVAFATGSGRRLIGRAGGRTWVILGLGAVFVAVYQTAFFAAVARTGVATGTVVAIGSGPAFAGLLARMFGTGVLTPRWMLATAGAVAGCAALAGAGQSAGVEPLGIALALLSGFGYAVYANIASYLITGGEDSVAVVGGLFGGAGVLLLPVLFASDPGWLLAPRGAVAIAYLGVITTGIGYVLYGRGLRTTPVPIATTLTLAEPAVAAVLGLVVLGEQLGGPAVAGLLLLAASLLILALPARR